MKIRQFQLWKKILAFCIAIISGGMIIFSVAVIALCISEKAYNVPVSTVVENTWSEALYEKATDIARAYMEDSDYKENLDDELYNSNIRSVVVSTQKGEDVYTYENDRIKKSDLYEETYAIYINTRGNYIYYHTVDDGAEGADVETLYVKIAWDQSANQKDDIAQEATVRKISAELKRSIYVIFVVSLVMFFLSLIYLFQTAGHFQTGDEPHAIWETKIPTDVQTIIFVIVGSIYGALLSEFNTGHILAMEFIFALSCYLLYSSLVLFYGVSIAIRIKTRVIFKNSLIAIVAKWFRKYVGEAFKNAKVVLKVALALVVLWLVEVFVIEFLGVMADGVTFILFVEKIVLLLVSLKWISHLEKLKAAGRKLAEGELSYTIDTSDMKWDLKEHGDNLNDIAKGMQLAVADGLKSERMKTELITNVSHDIKTPLTSIINYTDLIKKENVDNEKVAEYTEVLGRQSAKLKRLIEDLVEASKANTGNLDVELVSCDANIFVDQAEGEYKEKLDNANLTLVTKLPEENIKIMADGRRMWRVFDNLLNNICKYSVPGTRVYLKLEQIGNDAVISFKNTSKESLDLNPDELMERFVRGDKSRNTEGNGLGLSIVRSLTELQGGKIEISTDGDLFKVVLKFPVYNN